MKKILIVLIFLTCGCSTANEKEEGKNAFKAGLGAEVNPYIGSDRFYARAWLSGWIEAKAEANTEKEKK